ncbi:hypothetical protein JXO59_16715 [candidate division KSB1 bacterium]|nr:hypothetical protein [candidate division KSB1 bacterium]
MKLESIFWDYPKFTDRDYLIKFIRSKKDTDVYGWIMTRFLEYGRVVDTLSFFSIEEISRYLPQLKLTSYTRKKWNRLSKIYHGAARK